MSCERAIEENSQVVVEIRPSWRALILCWVIFFSPLWITLLVVFVLRECGAPPTVSVEDVNIHNMVVYQNTTDSPYQVRSEFSVNLTARNPNTVTKCFSTFRRMSVSVDFKGQQIVQQEVPLGFGLKPKESRTMMLDLRGDGYSLKKKSALLLDLELRNSSGVGLTISFESQVMRNDRNVSWIRSRCEMVARTPPNGDFSQANSIGGLVWSSCKTNKSCFMRGHCA